MEASSAFVSFVQELLFLAAALVIAGVRLPRAASWTLAGIGFFGYAWIVLGMNWCTGDADLFWKAGRAGWAGRNPYDGCAILNPPPSLLWYGLLSILPKYIYFAAFRLLAALASVGIVFGARAALGSKDEEADPLPAGDLAILAAAVALSVSVRYGLGSMSSSFLATVSILAALACRGRGKSAAAGVWMALGTLKITTQLPFLLLFLRKQDRKVWITMILFGLFASVLVIRPWLLPTAVGSNLGNIQRASGHGSVNDYSFEGNQYVGLISIDYAVYHLGIRDRGWVRGIQAAVLGALGIWTAWQVLRRPALPHAAACSVVACYSGLFLYHRLYDMTILAIPLVHAFARSRAEEGRLRWAFRGAALGILWVFFLRMGRIEALVPLAQGSGLVPRLVEALILPHGTWILLGTLLVLAVSERRRLEIAGTAEGIRRSERFGPSSPTGRAVSEPPLQGVGAPSRASSLGR